MNIIKKYFGDLFIPGRFYFLLGCLIILFFSCFIFTAFFPFAKIILYGFILLVAADYAFLFLSGKAPRVTRMMGERLSNSDINHITLKVQNRMNYGVNMQIIDELPSQLQVRNFSIIKYFAPREEKDIEFTVKPLERGVYNFGDTHLYVQSRLGLVIRRFTACAGKDVSVYPSFMQLKKYHLVSQTTLINEHGSKRMRKIGQSMEFEQIKEYVTGDDVRKLNWKATARKGALMINNYSDEKSQQVYCIIDKGRLMKMPFAGLTLLDYAINSALVMSSVCVQRQDKIGLITFAERMGSMVAADRKPVQRELIMQALYRQQTAFLESDFELLYMQVRQKIKQRSLLILYTNFESLTGLKRQIPYLRSLAKFHLLMIVFFENTELDQLAHAEANNVEEVYIKTIADKFVFEKKLIVKELGKYGILSILTAPENLTVNTINKYLELKTRQAI